MAIYQMAEKTSSLEGYANDPGSEQSGERTQPVLCSPPPTSFPESSLQGNFLVATGELSKYKWPVFIQSHMQIWLLMF